MPGRNGTGPMGQGSMTGRGLGVCNGVNAVGYGAGAGFGCRRGFGMNFIAQPVATRSQKEFLTEQKDLLQSRIDILSKQLENLPEDK